MKGNVTFGLTIGWENELYIFECKWFHHTLFPILSLMGNEMWHYWKIVCLWMLLKLFCRMMYLLQILLIARFGGHKKLEDSPYPQHFKRYERNSSFIVGQLWHHQIPIKISMFMIRLLTNKLPLDNVLTRLHFQLPFKCVCCLNSKLELLIICFLLENWQIMFGIFLVRAMEF